MILNLDGVRNAPLPTKNQTNTASGKKRKNAITQLRKSAKKKRNANTQLKKFVKKRKNVMLNTKKNVLPKKKMNVM